MKDFEDLKKTAYFYNLADNLFDADARKVYTRLLQNGYSAYFVGGCIRDLLTGYSPNDFDVVTSAKPKEIRSLFKNSRKVGKRFQLVHVFFQEKVIEVATFRGCPKQEGEKKKKSYIDNNVFGTHQEDASRRDFTINALYYDLKKKLILDYVNGVPDLYNHKVRIIGDTDAKLQEDPVRIIRAFKLASRFNFEMVSSLRKAIPRYISLLSQVPKPRLLFEILKILQQGFALDCFTGLANANILSVIAPDFQKLWEQPNSFQYKVLCDVLSHLDSFYQKHKYHAEEISLLSLFLFPLSLSETRVLKDTKSFNRLSKAALRLGIPKRQVEKIIAVIRTQALLEATKRPNVRECKQIASTEHFSAALDFLKIRSHEDPKREKIYQFWKQYGKK